MRLDNHKLAQRVDRARTAIKIVPRIFYKLGSGGMKPNDRTPAQGGGCDCSGFVSWCIYLSRDQRKKHNMWIETTAVYTDAEADQSIFVEIEEPVAGCLVVYPDYTSQGRHHEGHIAIVSEFRSKTDFDIIDCSAGRNGITEHLGLAFIRNRKTKFIALKGDIVG